MGELSFIKSSALAFRIILLVREGFTFGSFADSFILVSAPGWFLGGVESSYVIKDAFGDFSPFSES